MQIDGEVLKTHLAIFGQISKELLLKEMLLEPIVMFIQQQMYQNMVKIIHFSISLELKLLKMGGLEHLILDQRQK